MKHGLFKNILCLALVAVMTTAVPLVCFAGSENKEIEEPTRATLTGSSKTTKASAGSVTMSATTYYTGSASLTATAQLQRLVNGDWVNYPGGSVTKTATGTSVTAQKTVSVVSGYYYKTIGSHSGGGKTATSESSIAYIP